MRRLAALAATCSALALLSQAVAAEAFYGDPPDEHHPWCVHDMRREKVKIVTPGTFSTPETPGKPPSDAVILFDGSEASKDANWEADKPGSQPSGWEVKDGVLQCKPKSGYIRSKAKFGDIQLHIEWAAPKEVSGGGQGRGNSGIFLMNDIECQVLDNYDNPTYPDGTACAIYGINPPMANALRPPGEWQVVDIVFRRPLWNEKENRELYSGHETVFINGVLMQDAVPFEGPGGHMGRSKPRRFPETGNLRLQDHGNPVRYRNIWLRPLPPTPLEGGTDGYLSTEACMAKRHETAGKCREEAGKEADPLAKLKLTLESIVYEKDAAVVSEATAMATAYVASLKALGDKVEARKGEVKEVFRIFQYLDRHKILADFAPRNELLEQILKPRGWDKK